MATRRSPLTVVVGSTAVRGRRTMGREVRAQVRRWRTAPVGACGLALVVAAALGVAYAAERGLAFSLGWERADWFLRKAATRVAENVHDAIASPLNPADRFFLGYFVASFLVFGAIAFVRYERRAGHAGFLRFLFPRDVYLHRSARVDYAVFLINRIFSPAVLVTRLWSAAAIATAITEVLIAIFGVHERITPSGLWSAVAITVVGALVADFGDFLSHALHHRIPVLWEFHKLHHSAEVLTPITVARVHPMEQVVGALISTALTGAALGVAGYFFLEQPEPILFFGVQAVTFAFMAAGAHLRHSHVWLSWGPVLERIVISPAQHQVHHSVAPEHLDRNYGFIFALWDWMFGSLYVPRTKETLTYGLGIGVREHATVWAAYIDPFKAAARVVGRSVWPGTRRVPDDAAAR
jgi:sterol desaturase/sphingolipid hydroxylase (fatty acid hydroxylase superfamily)